MADPLDSRVAVVDQQESMVVADRVLGWRSLHSNPYEALVGKIQDKQADSHLVLGPLLEENIRRSLIVSAGDWSVFIERPISLIFILISILALALPIFSSSKNQQ